MGKGDRLLFYFAGHGITRKGKDGSPAGYLIPQDAKINLQNVQQDQSENFLPMQALYDAFKSIDCHHLLVILDCCYAGMFRWATRKLIPIPERIHREHYDRSTSFADRFIGLCTVLRFWLLLNWQINSGRSLLNWCSGLTLVMSNDSGSIS